MFAGLLAQAEGAAAILWLWLAGGQRPDRRDLAGGLVCLAGTAVILLGGRG